VKAWARGASHLHARPEDRIVRSLSLTAALLGITLFVGGTRAEEKGKAAEGNRGKEAQAHQFHLNGNWTVLYAEMDGKKLDDKTITNVSIHNGLLTCKRDGKEQSWRFNVQPGHRVLAFETDGKRATERGGEEAQPIPADKVRMGFYVAAPDFICLGLNKFSEARPGFPGAAPGAVPPGAPQPARGAQAAPGAAPGAAAIPQGTPVQTSEFVLVLKRNSHHNEKGQGNEKGR